MTKKQTSAIWYARHGYSIIPLHSVTEPGACDCGNAQCVSPGKHPRTAHGVKDATNDQAAIRNVWRRWPDANIGLATGKVNGICVVDIDPRHGGSIDDIEAYAGKLPDCPTVLTAGGGMHLYFRHRHGLKNDNTGKLGPGVDFKTDGGYVVAPPSTLGAKAWTWEASSHINDVPLPLLPDALIARLQTKTAKSRPKVETKQVYGKGERHKKLLQLAGLLRRHNANEPVLYSSLGEFNRRQCEPPYEDHDIRKIAADASKWEPLEAITMAARIAVSQPDDADPDAPPADPLNLAMAGEKVRPVLSNVIEILDKHPAWAGCVGYNEFHRRVDKTREAPTGQQAGPWNDTDDAETVCWLANEVKAHVAMATVADAVRAVARRHPFHPLRETLESLVWDGEPRVDSWLHRYMGVDPDETGLASAMGRCWLISAVARICDPGCKADTMLVLEGEQGIGKSRAAAALAMDDAWFSDELSHVDGSKDTAMSLNGVWIVEIAELAALRKSEVEQLKSFISRRIDRYREPYGRHVADFPRQCVFLGTTNADQYLQDETGNRRYWPVKCESEIDVDGLKADVRQIWAEAVQLYKAGTDHHLDREISEHANEHQKDRLLQDEWETLIRNYCIGKEQVTTGDILAYALDIQKDKWDQNNQKRVGRILRLNGWRRKNCRFGTVVCKAWVNVTRDGQVTQADGIHHNGNDINDLQNVTRVTPKKQKLSENFQEHHCSTVTPISIYNTHTHTHTGNTGNTGHVTENKEVATGHKKDDTGNDGLHIDHFNRVWKEVKGE